MSRVSVLPHCAEDHTTPLATALEIIASGGRASNDQQLLALMGTLKEEAGLRYALSRAWQELAAAHKAIDLLRAKTRQLREQLAEANQKTTEAQAYACYDELTGLPNRRLLKDRLQQALSHAERHKKQVAVLLIDMDGFKQINDTYGHAAGDQLLRSVARRLSAGTRASDTACRYGGDEFVVVVPDLEGERAIDAVIEKLHGCLQVPYLICGRELEVIASIGCAIYPGDGHGYHDLIERADGEMYRVKQRRKSR